MINLHFGNIEMSNRRRRRQMGYGAPLTNHKICELNKKLKRNTKHEIIIRLELPN